MRFVYSIFGTERNLKSVFKNGRQWLKYCTRMISLENKTLKK